MPKKNVVVEDNGMYPFAELTIDSYHPLQKRFHVVCLRCGNQADVPENMILEPLICPKCDKTVSSTEAQKAQQKQQPQVIQIPVVLMPISLKVPDIDEPILAFIPLMVQPGSN